MLNHLQKFKILLFFGVLLFVLVLEGFGIFLGRECAQLILFTAPALLYLSRYSKNGSSHIQVPRLAAFAYIAFIFMTLVSTFFSNNKPVSFSFTLIYISLFLLFLYSYNLPKNIRIHFSNFVLILSIFAVLYSLFLMSPLSNHLELLRPMRGYQFVYKYYPTQNPLGRWLIIPLVLSWSSFFVFHKKSYLVYVILFGLVSLFTFSRSAYIGFIAGVLLTGWLLKRTFSPKAFKKMLGLSIFTILIFVIMLFVTVSESENIPILNTINVTLRTYFDLPHKMLFGDRLMYYSVAIRAIIERPFTGYGPYNIICAFQKYSPSGKVAFTTENIFLEIFAENGIIAGIFFVIFIIIIIKTIFNKTFFDKEIIPLQVTFFSLLVMFQTDSSQRFLSFLLIFFIIAGMIHKEKQYYEVKPIAIVLLALIVFLCGQIAFFNQWFIP